MCQIRVKKKVKTKTGCGQVNFLQINLTVGRGPHHDVRIHLCTGTLRHNLFLDASLKMDEGVHGVSYPHPHFGQPQADKQSHYKLQLMPRLLPDP